MKIMPISVAYHRNGVSGEPFHCVIFDKTDNEGTNRMLAVRFADDVSEGFQNPRIAVFDLSLLSESNIEFGSNSYRGDYFVDAIDKIIATPTKAAYA
jgi:hypothetical protein